MTARRPGPWSARAVRACALACSLVGAGGAHAQSAFELPPSANASVAGTDDATGLFLNPAAAGLRRGPELAVSVIDAPDVPVHDARDRALVRRLYRGALVLGPFGVTITQPELSRVAYGVSLAAGGTGLRFGAALQSLTASAYAASLVRGPTGTRPAIERGLGLAEDRTTEVRFGALSRPARWLSLGAVLDHVMGPQLVGERLDRELTLGLGLRPLAFVAGRAHSLGTRLTLTADVRMREHEALESSRTRVGAEFEVVPGVVVRGAVEDHGGVRAGLSLIGRHSSVHGDAERLGAIAGPSAAAGDAAVGTLSATFHGAQERTVLDAFARKRVAVMRLGGTLGDEGITSVSVFGTSTVGSAAPVRRQLERALEDPLTRGVLLHLTGVSGMAQIEELRPRIAALRAAGKPVVAYIEYGGRRGDLFLAGACDRIVTTPESFWAALGLHSERRYYRKALADWGVRIDRTSYGQYKSAYRNYSVDSTSAADRESIDRGLDVAQNLFVSAFARDRQLSEDALRTVLDGRSWRAEDLQKLGIIDSVGYREDALRMLGRLARLGDRPRGVDLRNLREARREWRVPRPIAVVYASGGIEAGRSGNDLFSGAFMGNETVSRQIEAAFRNPEVKAVVLRIDSPGGSSVASDLMHHAVVRMKRETHKPLIVSMARAAASGGYHLAIAGDRIYADRFTITGSIGVLSVRYSLEEWLARHGIRQDDFDRGAYMSHWSTGHDWDARAQAAADSATYTDYRAFVDVVAQGRGMSWEAVDAVAQGRVWMGEDALARGLIDEIGGLDAAIAEARRRVGIVPGEKIGVVEYHRPRPGVVSGLVSGWLRAQWERNVHLPESGQARYWMDPDALTIE